MSDSADTAADLAGSRRALGDLEWKAGRRGDALREWNETGDARTWSCPFLAAVWQLPRLGLLRHQGRAVAVPVAWADEWPGDWERLPAVVRLSADAPPFFAYRTLSILARRFLPVEHAVRTILSQVAVDGTVYRQALDRSKAEGIHLPAEIVDRVEYVLTGSTAAWR